MIKIKYLLVLVVVSLLGSCAESGLDFDNELLSISELGILPEEVKVDDLLVENSLDEWKVATAKVLNNGIGKRLLQFVKNLSPRKAFIHFVPIVDKDGNLDRSSIRMTYGAGGQIGYTYLALTNAYNDELLFHEFFHVYQYAGRAPTHNRSDEVEAYLAQYLYAQSRGYVPWVIDKKFTEIMTRLVSCIDASSGYLRDKVDYEQFYSVYVEALGFLGDLPWYRGDDWTSGAVEYGSYPFQRLLNLLNQNL
ncbi:MULTISPECIES: hypothetical protein [Butyricimonas]|uniref:hypothetical protein n=1 Tax=Butyricimonas TaxID=574697 RepID=UPI0007FB3785|nr:MULTISPECIES: hypothetical protein [Butyricimonas]